MAETGLKYFNTAPLKEHNSEKVKSTKKYVPWTLLHKEFFSTLGEARKREQQIKNWKKRSSIEKLIYGSIV